MTKPFLIFGYGNLCRGDDALGPLLLERIKNKIDLDTIEVLTDFQLQIEHAMDLENRKRVLFVDASISCKTAFEFFELQSVKDKSYSTHAMSPAAILQVFQEINDQPPPPAFLLSIQGISFELGSDISLQAEQNLYAALQFSEMLLSNTELNFWSRQVDYMRESRLIL